MKVLVQRVKEANVEVDGKIVGKIDVGYVLYVGFCQSDTIEQVMRMAHRIPLARLFEDAQGKLNKSLIDVSGSILSISQFTLYADTQKGHRPSFADAMDPVSAQILYEAFNTELRKVVPVETGVFRAMMTITQVNDGPVSIVYES